MNPGNRSSMFKQSTNLNNLSPAGQIVKCARSKYRLQPTGTNMNMF